MTCIELEEIAKKELSDLAEFGLFVTHVFPSRNPEGDEEPEENEEDEENEDWNISLCQSIPEDEAYVDTHIIRVMHPFVFDRRLIPKTLLGYNIAPAILSEKPIWLPVIKNDFVYEVPKEFDTVYDEDMLIYEYQDPEKYVAFVERCEDKIKIALRNPNMDKKEILDALTGDFESHKLWVEQLKLDWILGK